MGWHRPPGFGPFSVSPLLAASESGLRPWERDRHGQCDQRRASGHGKKPEAGGKIMTTMIIGLALIESLCIYALVICFIMVFKIPDSGRCTMHPEKLWRLMGEHLPDGFSARPARSQKEIAEHCEAKVSMLSDAPSFLSSQPRARGAR